MKRFLAAAACAFAVLGANVSNHGTDSATPAPFNTCLRVQFLWLIIVRPFRREAGCIGWTSLSRRWKSVGDAGNDGPPRQKKRLSSGRFGSRFQRVRCALRLPSPTARREVQTKV